MLTPFFRGRGRERGAPTLSLTSRLRRLLQSPSLHPYRFQYNREIGPFIVGCVCRERSLIVEVQEQSSGQLRQEGRAALLSGLGYTVLQVSPQELLARPGSVLRRVRRQLTTKE